MNNKSLKEIKEEIEKEALEEIDRENEIKIELARQQGKASDLILDVIERGDKLNDLEEKTKEMINLSEMYLKKAKKVKRRNCCNEYKVKIIIIIIIIIILCILLGILIPKINI